MDLPVGPAAPRQGLEDEIARIRIFDATLTNCLRSIPIFDFSLSQKPSYLDLKSWIGILALPPWFEEPCGRHIRASLIILYQEAIDVYQKCPAIRPPATNDSFWIIVFRKFQSNKVTHSGAGPQTAKAIVAFMDHAFQQGMTAGQDGTRDISEWLDATLLHAIIHWLWLTQGLNYIVSLQGARFHLAHAAFSPAPPRQPAVQRFPWVYPMVYPMNLNLNLNLNMNNHPPPPLGHHHPNPAMLRLDNQAAPPAANQNSRKRPRTGDDAADQAEANLRVAPPANNMLLGEIARLQAANQALTTERDHLRARVQQLERQATPTPESLPLLAITGIQQ
ncbi:hypothetical protein F4775DRAFT_605385 [Biscogniauxia sp. FL1348]|nr:hypothetical protein F4775DRAFT_605385 [Biscogniauxia sp. FL1348]